MKTLRKLGARHNFAALGRDVDSLMLLGRKTRASQLLRSLPFIVLVAFAVRLIVVAVVYPDQLDPRRDHWPFGYETGRIARSIASEEGFANPLFEKTGPTAWMTPLYPYLVAAVFKTTGIYTKSSALILLALNSLFSALTCIPVFLMARESFGEKTAVWSGWAWAFFPYAIYLSVDWIWETCLTTLLLSLLFLISLRIEHSTKLTAWTGFGFLWGVTALSNPAVLSLLPFLVGWACYRLQKRRQQWGLQATAAVMALVLVVTPWFVRNYRTFHQFIPFRQQIWLAMHVGNNGDSSHWDPGGAHPSTSGKEEQEYNRLGELNYMGEKRREAIEFIRSHPGWYAWVTFRRFVFTWTGFWSFSREYLTSEPTDPGNIVMSVILLVLMLAGLRRAVRERNATTFLYGSSLIVFPFVYYVSFTQMPYRHPIDPLIVILAAYGAIGWLSSRKKKNLATGGTADAV
jgi:4-amino-4-deoxy-L-arabinose transferase-like glycosyltransferase